MQNSADSTAQPAKGKAQVDKKGFIRFEAVIPMGIMATLIVLYFTLFFDMHLRRGMEYAATQANGAEVNIDKLDTSFLHASITVGNIAMTNPELPDRNRLQIGQIKFAMVWDALLRGKVLIDEASILNVQIDTPRARAGYVVPVKPLKNDTNEPGFSDKVLARTKDEFSGNVLGDVAAIASGTSASDQLSAKTDNLQSTARIAELQKMLDEKPAQIKSSLAAMPKGEDFTALQRRLGNVKLDNLKNVLEVRDALKELTAIRDEYDAKAKTVREAGATLNESMGAMHGSISGLDKVIAEDVRNLQAQMHLPQLDAKSLSRALFGMDVLGKIQEVHGYMEKAREYMPAKSEKKPSPPRERTKGTNYVFGRVNSYPLFWLRHAAISSTQAESNLSGELRNVSTNPVMTGRPIVATLKGDLSQHSITGIKAELVMDHTQAIPVEHMVMEIGRYNVSGLMLVDSPNASLGFNKAVGSTKFSAELRGDTVDIHLNNQFTGVAMQTKAQSDAMREMLNASVAGLNAVNLEAQVSGTWSNLNWKLSTNLADELGRGMQRYMQARIDAAKARIEAMVHDKIDAQRKRLTARQAEIESGLKVALNERQVQIEKLRSSLDDARHKLEEREKKLGDAPKQKLKQDAKKTLDDLRKKF